MRFSIYHGDSPIYYTYKYGGFLKIFPGVVAKLVMNDFFFSHRDWNLMCVPFSSWDLFHLNTISHTKLLTPCIFLIKPSLDTTLMNGIFFFYFPPFFL